jgi:hypothetical protein
MTRDKNYIDGFLTPVARLWALDPDSRFGQFVSNVARQHCAADSSNVAVEGVDDDDFLLALNEFEEDTRRGREEFQRTPDEPSPRPELARLVRQTQQMYDDWALETFGRIGRDPDRIVPFLHRFGEAWCEHPERSFGAMVLSVVPLSENPDEPGRFARAGLRLIEDEPYLELLDDPNATSGRDIIDAYTYRGPLGDILDVVEGRHEEPPSA